LGAVVNSGQACGILQGLNQPLEPRPEASLAGFTHSHEGHVHRRTVVPHS